MRLDASSMDTHRAAIGLLPGIDRPSTSSRRRGWASAERMRPLLKWRRAAGGGGAEAGTGAPKAARAQPEARRRAFRGYGGRRRTKLSEAWNLIDDQAGQPAALPARRCFLYLLS